MSLPKAFLRKVKLDTSNASLVAVLLLLGVGGFSPTLVAQERATFLLPDPRPINSLVLSPDGRYLALVRNYYSLYLWDLQTKKVVGTLSGADKVVAFADFSPDGKTLATRYRGGRH